MSMVRRYICLERDTDGSGGSIFPDDVKDEMKRLKIVYKDTPINKIPDEAFEALYLMSRQEGIEKVKKEYSSPVSPSD